MNMHALCSAFLGVRAGDVLSHIHRYERGRQREGEGGKEREIARGNEQRDREGGWRGKEGAAGEKRVSG